MAFLYQVGVELKEVRNHQQADMHSVDIGIGRDNHLVITQVLDAVGNVEGGVEQIELFVGLDVFLRLAKRVERLSAQ